MQRTSERRKDRLGSVRVIPPEGDLPTPPPDPAADGPIQSPTTPSPKLQWPIAIVGTIALVLAVAWSGSSSPSGSTDEVAPPTSPSLRADEAGTEQDAGQPGEIRSITVPVEANLATWSRGRIDDVTSAVDMTVYSGRFAALATTPTGPQIITSSSGSAWTSTDRFDSPADHAGFLDVVAHKGRLVAFGMVGNELVAWRSPTASTWELQEPIEEFGFAPAVVAASNGQQLILVASSAGIIRMWTSEDGVTWSRTAGSPLLAGRTEIVAAAAWNDWFYIAGTECVEAGCFPSVVRSRDGSRWEPLSTDYASPAAIDPRPGSVTHLLTAGNGLVAIGHVDDGAPRAAVWLAPDGEQFRPAPAPTALSPLPVSIRVSQVSGDEVRLTIGGTIHRVEAGETLDTPFGPFTVDGIDGEEFELTTLDQTSTLRAGQAFTLASRSVVLGASAEGRRIVAVGTDATGSSTIPVAWASADAGLTWERVELPAADAALAQRVAIRGGSIAVIGSDAEGALAWTGQWRTEPSAFVAERTARAFLDAVQRGDANRVIAALAAAERPSFAALPALASIDLASHWWGDDGVLAPQAIDATLGYLSAMHTAVRVGDCRTSVTLGSVDITEVSCEYTGTSDLIEAMGFGDDEGTVRIRLRDDNITEFSASGRTSSLWTSLASWTAQMEPEMLVHLPDPSDPNGAPLTAENAAIHLNLAGQLREQILTPGDTTVTDSPLGRIEWSWIETSFGPNISLGPIRATDMGLIASTYSTAGANQPGLWLSDDGFEWTPLPTPDAEWFGDPRDFGDGLLLAGWHRNQERLWAFRDGEWIEIELDLEYTTSGLGGGGFEILAVLDGTALVRSTKWTASGDLAEQRIGLVHQDLGFEEVELPEGMYASGEPYPAVIIATSSDGAVAVAHHWPDPPTIWYSQDLRTWQSGGELPELARAGVSTLTYHEGTILATSWREDSECLDDGTESFCFNPMELWTGEAGGQITRVETITDTETITIGFGPLGGVGVVTAPSFGEGARLNRLIGSNNTRDWTQWAEPILSDPAATWMWATGVSVGDDRIVIGFEVNRSPRDGTSFQPIATMLVGRLVDG